MRPFRASVWAARLRFLAASGGATQAAWNNVFEACCWELQESHDDSQRPSARELPAATAMHHPVRTAELLSAGDDLHATHLLRAGDDVSALATITSR